MKNKTFTFYELILKVKRGQSGFSVCQSVKNLCIICISNVYKLNHSSLWLNQARCSELLERIRLPLSRELEKKAILFLKNSSCRKISGLSTPEDFLRERKSFKMRCSIL